MTYHVTFWGTRGSIPAPGPATVRHGGNTACVALTGSGRQPLVLDAGTGIRSLGETLMGNGSGPVTLDVLLSHTHWDHIQGLPFFQPLYRAGNRVRLVGPAQEPRRLEDVLRRQMDPDVFPVPLSTVAADLQVREIHPGPVPIEGYEVTAFRLRHQGMTVGYRVRPDGASASVAYVTDNELGAGGDYDLPSTWRDTLVEELRGVHTLIHDAMYSEELKAERIGWGHSTPEEALDLARECGARHLVLFHHAPDHGDEVVDALVARAQARAAATAPGLVVEAAREGAILTLS